MPIIPISKNNLSKIAALKKVIVPNKNVFEYPEKIIQFGTGVLLKGLPGYFINKANNEGIFKGRIIAVKSTSGDDEIQLLKKQDNLYFLLSRGYENGESIVEANINASISRVLHAQTEWEAVLHVAKSSDLQIVISNTTEIGLTYPEENDLSHFPPKSYLGKLLRFLEARYNAFEDKAKAGLVIIPTELVVGNGDLVKDLLEKLAEENGFDSKFISWLKNENIYCNSLVDRIVPGKPDAETKTLIENTYAIDDKCAITSETYRLWAIKGDEKVQAIASFSKADRGVVIAKNIDQYRELKLRLLNGSHTLMVGYSFLQGMKTVGESLNNPEIANFFNDLLFKELVPGTNLDQTLAHDYAKEVLDRFKNPNIQHQLLSITLQYSSKIKARTLPLLQNYVKNTGELPKEFCKGFAAFIVFMKAVKEENGAYFGEFKGAVYPIQDINADYFYQVWQNPYLAEMVNLILKNEKLWGQDLTKVKNFEQRIIDNISELLEEL
jgi:tagaturonate reductase